MFLKRMKHLLAALLACALLISLAPTALAQEYPCTGTMKAAGVLRKAASESAVVLAALPAGDAVYITGESGSYYIVEYDGMAGYVPKSMLVLGGEAAVNLPSAEYAARYAALYQGSEGDLVRDLQSALIELGFLSGKADGKYGAKTAQAVADFQLKNKLNDSGSADAATLGLLFEGKPQNSKGKAKAVSVAPDIAGFPVSQGKKGALVSRVQAALKALEYYTGKVDGSCGSGTVSAIKKFQKKHGLTASGVADAQTQELLFGGSALSAKATATPVPTSTPVPPVIGWENGVTAPQATYPFETVTLDAVNLRKKASVSSTRVLTVPKGASVTVLALKGDFAQIDYRTSKKTYTGYVMARYVDVPAIYYGGKELEEDEAARLVYTSLSEGSYDPSVSVLQDALRELGFYSGASSGGYDANTIAAVKAFQSKNDLLQTGVATPELQKLIYEGKPLNSKGKKTSVSVLPPVEDVTMQQGDSGYQVTELQQALKTLGYYTWDVNGVYDANTVKAVKALQKARGLTADGIAGARVQQALKFLLSTPTPQLNLVVATPTPITADNVIVIHRGTRGLAVTRLQQQLVALGYYSITPDGVYDADDIAAVRAFQQKNGLTADGVAGLETQQKLYGAEALPAWATATPKPAATPKPTATTAPSLNSTLKIGSKGDEVNLLQARLTLLNYFSETIDGRFGTQTAAAVAAFQQNNGLTADGVAGPKTLQKLYSASAKTAPVAQATQAPAVTTALRLGDRGEAVKTLQRLLIGQGYLSGAADGIFGPKTYLAVKNFQKENKLDADGIAGALTLNRLQALAQSGASTTPAPSNTGTVSADFKAPSPAEVRYADWYTETRVQAKLMPNAIIYDYMTGLHYSVNMFSFGKHADAEPITASDTAIMYQIMGKDDWTPHAVWVILSDGKVYMASTHSHGHEVDHNSANGLEGHICIHFPREMSDSEKASMPYATRHQQEILRGWEETQQMIGAH